MTKINGQWKSIALVLIAVFLGAGGSQLWTGQEVAANTGEISSLKVDIATIQTDVKWIRKKLEGGEAK